MKVTVEPISANVWSNIIHYKNCYTDISTYFLKNGRRYTGFTKENKEDQVRLEKELGLDLKPESSFWDTFFVRMQDKPLILSSDDPLDELRQIFLSGHKLVARSQNEPKATAKYVIVNQEAEAVVKNRKSKIKREAISAFNKLSSTQMTKALRLYGYKAEGITNEIAEAKLFDLVESDPQQFLNIWVNNKDKDTQYLIELAISKNIIRKNKNAYHYGTEIIGHSLEDTIGFLDDKKNQDLKLVILNESNVK